MRRAALALALCLAFAGCSNHAIRLDDFEDAKVNIDRPREVKSETCGVMVSFIPFRMRSQLIRASQDLKRSANGGVLTNIRVQESWYWLVLADLLCTEIRATAYPRVP